MNVEQIDYDLITKTLGSQFDYMYYVNIETGTFKEILSASYNKMQAPKEGDDFFEFAKENAPKIMHPDDIDMVLGIHDRETLLNLFATDNSYIIVCRLLIDGKIIHIRHINILCDDKKHILFCMENIEREFREKEEQQANLQSAQRLARRDELTGVKNKKAYAEEVQMIEGKIAAADSDYNFGIVMCDINDLKIINDTRGHSFGDEAIQSSSSMICNVYKHSPVFRIGGDEFAVILSGSDYNHRDKLLAELREESIENKRARSGPVIACGMAVYDPSADKAFEDVFKRADELMYENKKVLKTENIVNGFRKMDEIDTPIPPERKRLLDGMFGALMTVSGGGYVYLNDMKYDFSRWSLALVDDFGIDSEYMYHADKVWLEYIHPDDIEVYREAVDAVLCGNAELRSIYYRARKPDGSYVLITTKGFVLSDKDGNPEYFGGIMVPQK